jgi:hypothetical protein
MYFLNVASPVHGEKSFNLSPFVVGSKCDREGNLPLRSRVVRTGDSQLCRCSPIFTNSSMPTPAMPIFIRCGGKIVRSNVPVVKATTLAPGARTTTAQASNATAAKPADGHSTTSHRRCWPRASGHAPTGSSQPFCCACRARRIALPGSSVSISARAITGAGGCAILP